MRYFHQPRKLKIVANARFASVLQHEQEYTEQLSGKCKQRVAAIFAVFS